VHLLTRTRRGGARRRLVTRGSLTALLTVGLLAPVGLASAAADVPTGEPLPAAAGWVARQLAADTSPSVVELADAILAYAATGSAGDAGDAALAEMIALRDTATDNAGDAAKSLLAAAVQGADQATLDELEAELLDHMDPAGETAGRFPVGGQTQLFVQSLAILALEATGGDAPAAAVDFLAAGACDTDGSYDFSGGCTGDVDTTAVAAQALRAAGRDASAQIAFLVGAQNSDGSFGAPGDENTNSTALAAQALRHAGETAAADEALAWVLGQQNGCEAPEADRGSFAAYTDADGDLWIATTQAPFADSAALHELDATASAAETAYLNCSDDFCGADGGVSVVVDFTALVPDSEPVVACAPRLPADRDGLDVLRAAGFEITTEEFDFGSGPQDFLCSIEGLPEDGCSSSDGYFSYWHAPRGGDWSSYNVGASSSDPQDGMIEGWAWAPGYVGAPPRVSTTPTSSALPEPPYDRGITDACPGSYPRTFTDTAGSVHEPAIRCLAAAGITKGTSDPGRYAPREDVTRAQLASFLARSYEETTGEALPPGRDRFTDVGGGTHGRNINALAAADVIKGVGDGTRYAPNQTVNRAQMAALLARFLDLLDDGEVDGSFPPVTDRDVFGDDDGSTHEASIDRLAVQGVVQGRADGTYGPLRGVTRDQLATFLARSLDLAVDARYGAPVG
jgi:hypothetical protein